PAATIEQEAVAASGGGCDLTGTVEDVLQADAEIERVLPSIRRDRRSVANALALWKGEWVEPDRRLPPEALAAIKTGVERAVAAAPGACRRQILRGPRLLYLPGEGKTTVLAMGSGEWTWQAVADGVSAERERVVNTSDDTRPDTQKPQPRTRMEKLRDRIFGN
ncbi:MAG: hypothetical protein WA908_11010, partial [Pontixanthobacter sp.]